MDVLIIVFSLKATDLLMVTDQNTITSNKLFYPISVKKRTKEQHP